MKAFLGWIVVLLFVSMPMQLAHAVLPNLGLDGKQFPSLAPMLKQVNPAVVNISTYSKRESSYNPLLNDPFFRKFFDLPEPDPEEQLPQRRQQSAGSGVIVI